MWWWSVLIAVIVLIALTMYFLYKPKSKPKSMVVEHFGWDVDGDSNTTNDYVQMSAANGNNDATIKWPCTGDNFDTNAWSNNCGTISPITPSPTCELSGTLSIDDWTITANNGVFSASNSKPCEETANANANPDCDIAEIQDTLSDAVIHDISCDDSNAIKTFTDFDPSCTLDASLSVGDWNLEKDSSNSSNIIAKKTGGCTDVSDDFITVDGVEPRGNNFWSESYIGKVEKGYCLNECYSNSNNCIVANMETNNSNCWIQKNISKIPQKLKINNTKKTYVKKVSNVNEIFDPLYYDSKIPVNTDNTKLLDLSGNYSKKICKKICAPFEYCRGIVHDNTSNCKLIQSENDDIGDLKTNSAFTTYLKQGISANEPCEPSSITIDLNSIQCNDNNDNANATFTKDPPDCVIQPSGLSVNANGQNWEITDNNAIKTGGCTDVSDKFITVDGVEPKGNNYKSTLINQRGNAPLDYLLNECNSNNDCTVALEGSIGWAGNNTAWMNSIQNSLPTKLKESSEMTTYLKKNNIETTYNDPINKAMPSDSNLLLDLSPNNLDLSECKSVCNALEHCRGVVHDNTSNCKLIQSENDDIVDLKTNSAFTTYLKQGTSANEPLPICQPSNITINSIQCNDNNDNATATFTKSDCDDIPSGGLSVNGNGQNWEIADNAINAIKPYGCINSNDKYVELDGVSLETTYEGDSRGTYNPPVQYEQINFNGDNIKNPNFCLNNCDSFSNCLHVLVDKSTKTCDIQTSLVYDRSHTCSDLDPCHFFKKLNANTSKKTYFKKSANADFLNPYIFEKTLPIESNLLLDLSQNLDEDDCKSVCNALDDCRGIVFNNNTTSNCQLIQSETSNIGQLSHTDGFYTLLKNDVTYDFKLPTEFFIHNNPIINKNNNPFTADVKYENTTNSSSIPSSLIHWQVQTQENGAVVYPTGQSPSYINGKIEITDYQNVYKYGCVLKVWLSNSSGNTISKFFNLPSPYNNTSWKISNNNTNTFIDQNNNLKSNIIFSNKHFFTRSIRCTWRSTGWYCVEIPLRIMFVDINSDIQLNDPSSVTGETFVLPTTLHAKKSCYMFCLDSEENILSLKTYQRVPYASKYCETNNDKTLLPGGWHELKYGINFSRVVIENLGGDEYQITKCADGSFSSDDVGCRYNREKYVLIHDSERQQFFFVDTKDCKQKLIDSNQYQSMYKMKITKID